MNQAEFLDGLREATTTGEHVFARRFRAPFPGVSGIVDLLLLRRPDGASELLALNMSAADDEAQDWATRRPRIAHLVNAAFAGGGEPIPIDGFNFWEDLA